jgi:hypothetical protein
MRTATHNDTLRIDVCALCVTCVRADVPSSHAGHARDDEEQGAAGEGTDKRVQYERVCTSTLAWFEPLPLMCRSRIHPPPEHDHHVHEWDCSS